MHDVEYLGILKKDIISQYRKDEEKYGFETNEGPTWGRYQPGWGKWYSRKNYGWGFNFGGLPAARCAIKKLEYGFFKDKLVEIKFDGPNLL